MLKKILICILCFICIFYSATIYAFSDVSQQVKVHIDSSVLVSSPNQKDIDFYLRINLPKGWYTYYKNPGDIGSGITANWDLPSNITTSELEFPTPEKHTMYNVTNYVYKKRLVKLPFQLSLNNVQNSQITLKGRVNFLICNKACVPISKEVNKTVLIDSKTVKNPGFIKVDKNLIPNKIRKTTFYLEGNYINIRLLEDTSKALFIPDMDKQIDDLAEQKIVLDKQYLQIVKDKDFSTLLDTKITGRLVTDEGTFKIEAEYTESSGITFTSFKEVILIALLAFLGGVILNLMPCVLPILGLKIFALIKHETSRERIKSAVVYSFGIFTSMMLIVAILLMLNSLGDSFARGFQLQNHLFVWFLIVLLLLVGLDLLSVLPIGSMLSSKIKGLSKYNSGEFLAGFLTSFIASSCSAPFMASSIGFALASNSTLITFVVFAFFALGMAMPILIIAIYPPLQRIIPKPGDWMEQLKQFLSFPIFATALWLLWILYGFNYLVIIASIILFIVICMWLFKLKNKIILVSWMCIILISSIIHIHNSKKFIEKPLPFNKEKIEQLNAQGKVVFVDFTAKWCLTCKFNQATVIHTEEFMKFLKVNDIVYMEADWTNKDVEISKELRVLKQASVPTYVLYQPNLRPMVLPTMINIDDIAKYFNLGNN